MAVCLALGLALVSIDRWLGRLAGPVIESQAGKAGFALRIETIRTHFWDGRLTLLGMNLSGTGGSPLGSLRRLDLSWSWPDLLHGEIRLLSLEIEGLMLQPGLLARDASAGQMDFPALQGLLKQPPLTLETLEVRRSQYDDGQGGSVQLRWLRLDRIPNAGNWNFSLRSKADMAWKRKDGTTWSMRSESGGSVALHADDLRLVHDGEWRFIGPQASVSGVRMQAEDGLLSGKAGYSLRDGALEFNGTVRVDGLSASGMQMQVSAGKLTVQGRQRFVPGSSRKVELQALLHGENLKLGSEQGEAFIDALDVPLHGMLRQRQGEKPEWRIAAGGTDRPWRLHLSRPDAPALPLIVVEKLGWPALDSAKPELGGEFSARLRVGESPEIGRVRVHGNLAALAHPVAGSVTMAMEMEAAPFSRFAEREFGLRLDAGRIKMDAGATLKDGGLSAETRLKMIHLRVSNASSKRLDALRTAIGLSPDAALDLLRDANDVIELEVPFALQPGKSIKGLSIGLQNVYARAMVGALKKAALGYVKNLFQPYGMAIDAVQWLGEQSLKMRLSPVFFRPGLAALAPEASESLARVAKLLTGHPKLSVAVCGVVTGGEAKLVDGGPDAWKKLAQARTGRAVEGLLERGVSRDQITLCHEQKDDARDAKPRAEVLL